MVCALVFVVCVCVCVCVCACACVCGVVCVCVCVCIAVVYIEKLSEVHEKITIFQSISYCYSNHSLSINGTVMNWDSSDGQGLLVYLQQLYLATADDSTRQNFEELR